MNSPCGASGVVIIPDLSEPRALNWLLVMPFLCMNLTMQSSFTKCQPASWSQFSDISSSAPFWNQIKGGGLDWSIAIFSQHLWLSMELKKNDYFGFYSILDHGPDWISANAAPCIPWVDRDWDPTPFRDIMHCTIGRCFRIKARAQDVDATSG